MIRINYTFNSKSLFYSLISCFVIFFVVEYFWEAWWPGVLARVRGEVHFEGSWPRSQFPLNPDNRSNKEPNLGFCLTCITMMTHKRCSTKKTGCGELKEKSEFGTALKYPDQLNSECNACVAKRSSKKQKIAGKDVTNYKTHLRNLIKSKCLRTTVAKEFYMAR